MIETQQPSANSIRPRNPSASITILISVPQAQLPLGLNVRKDLVVQISPSNKLYAVYLRIEERNDIKTKVRCD